MGLEERNELSERSSDALQTLVEIQLQELDIVDLLLQLLRTQALQVALDLVDKVGERVNSEVHRLCLWLADDCCEEAHHG